MKGGKSRPSSIISGSTKSGQKQNSGFSYKKSKLVLACSAEANIDTSCHRVTFPPQRLQLHIIPLVADCRPRQMNVCRRCNKCNDSRKKNEKRRKWLSQREEKKNKRKGQQCPAPQGDDDCVLCTVQTARKRRRIAWLVGLVCSQVAEELIE
jgi:hypothetical protein